MLKKRAEVSQTLRSRHLLCSGLDNESEAPSYGLVYSRHSFGIDSCHAGFGRRQHNELQIKLLRVAWRMPSAKVLLAIGSERSLTIFVATEIAVFQRLWELAANQDATSLFCGQVAPRRSARSRSTQIGEHRVL
jgi:hypothetical protein